MHPCHRYAQYKKTREAIDKHEGGLEQFSRGYERLGFNRRSVSCNFPNAYCASTANCERGRYGRPAPLFG